MAKKFEIVYGVQFGKYIVECGSWEEAVKCLNSRLSAMADIAGTENWKIVEIRKPL